MTTFYKNMKYIFITYSGLGLPIAYKLIQEGCEVKVGMIDDIKEYCMEEEVATATESEFDKRRRTAQFQNVMPIQDANKVIEWAKTLKNPHEYFFFFDENNLYRWADKVRDLGFEGIFPTREDYLFEVDREMAKKFVATHYSKLYTPEVKEFDKVEDAIPFLEKTQELWVLKGKHDSAKTFVPDIHDPQFANQQVVEMLKNYPEHYEQLGFILELFIPSIIEMTPEKFYYDGVPIGTSIDFENKSFGSGNLSVQTGCAEDLVFPTNMEDRVNQISFPPIVDEMARAHKGLFIWDASILINKRDGKMYFGEFCSNRFGYNSVFTELAQSKSIDEFFTKMVHKENPYTIGTVAASVRIFNMNRDEKTEQVAENMALNFLPEIERDLWLWDVKRKADGQFLTVGTDWNLAVMTGSGKSIEEAVGNLYKNIEGLAFVGGYFRPKDDYLSLDYPTSILNRVNYGMERGLYKIPFNVKIGDIV